MEAKTTKEPSSKENNNRIFHNVQLIHTESAVSAALLFCYGESERCAN